MKSNTKIHSSGNKPTKVRWGIIALIFCATTINYIDRQVIGLLKPTLQHELGWSEADFGYIITIFNIAYAVGMIVGGRMLDKFGTRIGYTITIFVWSLGGMLHAAVRTVLGFSVMRAILGIGEAGNFPAAVKTTAEWFPKRDRAFATGVFNSGSTIGAITAPFIVAVIAESLGWEWAFIITGAMGFVWIIEGLIYYNVPEKHSKVNRAELEYIQDKEPNEGESESQEVLSSRQVSWYKLFVYPQTYGIFLGRFVTDWVWWFFLFWIPDYIMSTQNVDLKATVLPLVIIYTMASCGGLAGGAVSSHLIKAGRSIDYARKTTILIFGCLVLLLNVVPYVNNIWIIAVLIGIAASTHQAWASNIYTVVSDIYPKHLVASMTGISSVGGAIGGALGATFVGLLLHKTGSYALVFMVASCMYIMAWLFLKIFIRRIQPLNTIIH